MVESLYLFNNKFVLEYHNHTIETGDSVTFPEAEAANINMEGTHDTSFQSRYYSTKIINSDVNCISGVKLQKREMSSARAYPRRRVVGLLPFPFVGVAVDWSTAGFSFCFPADFLDGAFQ